MTTIMNTDKITTDRLNDIISEWVDAEIPRTAGDRGSADDDSIVERQAKRFREIVNMDDEAFRSLYAEKTGEQLSPMNSDGSYSII